MQDDEDGRRGSARTTVRSTDDVSYRTKWESGAGVEMPFPPPPSRPAPPRGLSPLSSFPTLLIHSLPTLPLSFARFLAANSLPSLLPHCPSLLAFFASDAISSAECRRAGSFSSFLLVIPRCRACAQFSFSHHVPDCTSSLALPSSRFSLFRRIVRTSH